MPVDARFEATGVTCEALLEQVANGSESAFGTLYDRLGRASYGLALRVLRDGRFAEDVVQEAFFEIWRFAPRFAPERGSARAFVLTIVHRRAVDRIRREDRHRPKEAIVVPHEDPASADESIAAEERSDVRSGLAGLPAVQRQAIELAYYDGMTQTEIAQHLAVPVGTIKSRTPGGLRALAGALDPRTGETEGDRAARRAPWVSNPAK